MLVIRREQMKLLEADAAKRFFDSLRKHLRTDLHNETHALSDDEILPMLKVAVERGRQYGVTTERDLMLFVDLVFLLGPRFEDGSEMNWAKRILLNKQLEGAAKMGLIYKQLAARQAQEKSQDHDL